MNSQRDSADNVFFNAVPKSDAPTPYTKSQLDPTTQNVINISQKCTARLKLPKYSTTADGSDGYVAPHSYTGDFEYTFGLINPGLTFPATSQKVDGYVGKIEYEDQSISKDLSILEDIQSEQIFSNEATFNPFTPLSVSTNAADAATAGVQRMETMRFANREGAIPPKLIFLQNLALPIAVDSAVDGKIVQQWFTLKHQSDPTIEDITVTCSTTIGKAQHRVAMMNKNFVPSGTTNAFKVQNTSGCDTDKSCIDVCEGGKCPFKGIADKNSYKVYKNSTHINIPCVVEMEVTKELERDGTFDGIFDSLYDMTIGANVYDNIAATASTNLFSKVDNKIYVEFPSYNFDFEEPEILEPFWRSSKSETITGLTFYQEVSFTWFTSDLITEDDTMEVKMRFHAPAGSNEQ